MSEDVYIFEKTLCCGYKTNVLWFMRDSFFFFAHVVYFLRVRIFLLE